MVEPQRAAEALLRTAAGLIVLGTSFLLYRLATPIPNSSMSGIGVLMRVLVAYIAAGGCFAASSWAARQPAAYDAIMAQHPGHARWDENYEPPPAPSIPQPSEPHLEPAAPPALPSFLERVNTIIEDRFSKDVQPVGLAQATFNDDEISNESLQSFALRSVKAGALTEERLVDKIFTAVTKSLPDGSLLWAMHQDLVNDSLVFQRKQPFPPVLFPPLPESVVVSKEEALRRYETLKFPLGEDAYGNRIEITPKRFPHGLVVGGSGSGKSVFTRGLIEFLRANGWQIIIVDGKMADYVRLVNEPGVTMCSGDLGNWIRTIFYVEDNMDARYKRSQERKRKGLTPEFDEPPMLFLVDEAGSVMRNVREKYGKTGFEMINSSLKNIAAKGRQAKVHLILASQDVYNSTFEGDLKANLSFRVALGELAPRTLEDAFSVDVRSEAQRIAASITGDDPGRGIIETNNDGKRTVVEFQTYFAYSPGNEDGIPDQEPVHSQWTTYKEQVSDKVPLLYPRIWWMEPPPKELENLEDPSTLRNYEMVVLQRSDGSIAPGMELYDRMSDDYVQLQYGDDDTSALLHFCEDNEPVVVDAPSDVDANLERVDSAEEHDQAAASACQPPVVPPPPDLHELPASAAPVENTASVPAPDDTGDDVEQQRLHEQQDADQRHEAGQQHRRHDGDEDARRRVRTMQPSYDEQSLFGTL